VRYGGGGGSKAILLAWCGYGAIVHSVLALDGPRCGVRLRNPAENISDYHEKGKEDRGVIFYLWEVRL